MNYKSIHYCLMILSVMGLLACGEIKSTQILTDSPVQYGKTEWEIKLKTEWVNPYDANEIALDMILTSPSGKQLVLPCYFESGESGAESVWKARFAAQEAGTYQYAFKLSRNGNVVNETKAENFTVSASNAKGFLKTNDFWTLRYDNGELFRGIGMNVCWESRDEDDSRYFKGLHEDKRFNYDYMLSKLAANGGNFFRTWMIYWNLPVDWKTVNNNSRYQNTALPYNPSGMKRMDELVELCDSLGIHMMLALESHVGYMGTGWETSSYNLANGGAAKTPLEFFSLPEARAQYKNKLRLMVARYGYSPSIGAWEFFNEIDNVMYHGKPEDRIPDEVITEWHTEMSAYLKSIDPFGHIVTTSVSHRDVAGMNNIAHIDINQKHIYKHTFGIPSTIREYTQKYNKPYVIGECGYEWDWSKNFNDFANEMDSDFKRGLWYGLFSPTPILPMSWWWEFFENRGMMEYFNKVATINKMMIEAGKGEFQIVDIATQHDKLTCFAVKCGNTKFVYLYNTGDKPERITLSNLSALPIGDSVKALDCETGEVSRYNFDVLPEIQISLNNMDLAPGADMVFIWNKSN